MDTNQAILKGTFWFSSRALFLSVDIAFPHVASPSGNTGKMKKELIR